MLTLDLPVFPNDKQPVRQDGYPVLNDALMRTTIDLIEKIADSGHWNQGIWRGLFTPRSQDEELEVNGHTCGTAMCYAGWATHLASPVWAEKVAEGGWDLAVKGYVPEDLLATQAEIDDDQSLYHTGGPFNGKHTVPVVVRARNVLGITEREGGWLFEASNTLEMLRKKVALILDGATRTVSVGEQSEHLYKLSVQHEFAF